jgi:DNA-directed RNA polymerase specialized sigma24 family protein
MIQQLSDVETFGKIREKLVYLAWHKYRIRRDFSEDIIQIAITTYCEVRGRYSGESNQYGILLGIFNKKCLEHIDRSVRERRRLEKYLTRPDNTRGNPWLDPEGNGASRGVLDDLVHREEGRLILSAIADLRPEAKEMFRLLVDEEMGRQGLLSHYGLNKNTLDSRLHVFRTELRSLLRKADVES